MAVLTNTSWQTDTDATPTPRDVAAMEVLEGRHGTLASRCCRIFCILSR